MKTFAVIAAKISIVLFLRSQLKIRLLKGLPNTYAYTKALTEDLVNSYSGQIPIVITRPSIGKNNCRVCVNILCTFEKSNLNFLLLLNSDGSMERTVSRLG